MTQHHRAAFVQAMMQMVEIDSNESSSHKDTRKSDVLCSEAYILKVMEAMENFNNLFEVDNKDVLHCLSSGLPAPRDVEQNLLSADKSGKEA